MIHRRTSGVLVHITSLPSPYGIGDLGPSAHRMADLLYQAHQGLWQVLPLVPTSTNTGDSPYSSSSAFAGNPLLISPELLLAGGLLTEADLAHPPPLPRRYVDYPAVTRYKAGLLQTACRRFHDAKITAVLADEYARFVRREAHWLEDYALFQAIRHQQGNRPWDRWPAGLRNRRTPAMRQARAELAAQVERQRIQQYLFHRQWEGLKQYCNQHQVLLVGDVAIYVAYDSADVWAHREIFQLTRDGRPRFVAGVPGNRFRRSGQLWGNPLYNWARLREGDYRWWLDRMARHFQLYDWVRIDHFLGLLKYWRIPYGSRTALRGQWIDGPGDDLLYAMFRRFVGLPVVIEDLGTIAPQAEGLVRRFELPNMRVVQFGFEGDPSRNPHAPHNHQPNSVVYTGTHDTDTARGWFQRHATPAEKHRLRQYLGHTPTPRDVAGELIRLAMSSVAGAAMIPMQDVLGLGSQARMNVPGTPRGNWRWRFTAEQLRPEMVESLAEITALFGRA